MEKRETIEKLEVATLEFYDGTHKTILNESNMVNILLGTTREWAKVIVIKLTYFPIDSEGWVWDSRCDCEEYFRIKDLKRILPSEVINVTKTI